MGFVPFSYLSRKGGSTSCHHFINFSFSSSGKGVNFKCQLAQFSRVCNWWGTYESYDQYKHKQNIELTISARFLLSWTVILGFDCSGDFLWVVVVLFGWFVLGFFKATYFFYVGRILKGKRNSLEKTRLKRYKKSYNLTKLDQHHWILWSVERMWKQRWDSHTRQLHTGNGNGLKKDRQGSLSQTRE